MTNSEREALNRIRENSLKYIEYNGERGKK